jgi:signal transduction histidine kinase/ActR/RegA family two-component response regulator
LNTSVRLRLLSLICLGGLWLGAPQASPDNGRNPAVQAWEIAVDAMRPYRESGRGATLQDAFRAIMAEDVGNTSAMAGGKGGTDGPLWLLTDGADVAGAVAADPAGEYLLLMPEGRLWDVEAWIVPRGGAGAGDAGPDPRPLTRHPYRYPVFELPAAAAAGPILVRIGADQPVPPRWRLQSAAAGHQALILDSAIIGAAYAIILAALLLDVLMLIAVPRLDQWVLLVALPLITLDLANRDGVLALYTGSALPPPLASAANNLIVVAGVATYITYLELRLRLPWLFRSMLGVMVLALGAGLLATYHGHHQVVALGLMMLVIALALPAGLYLALRGEFRGWIGVAVVLLYGLPMLCVQASDLLGLILPALPPMLLTSAVAVTMLGVLIAFAHRAYQLHQDALRANRALQRHRQTLERTVSERTADLTAAAGRAERANRAKDDFLARMSHELRTPLNAILGYAQWLADGRLDAEQERSRKVIESAGRHQLQLVNDLLDVSRIESGRLELQPRPLALGAFLDTQVAAFRVQAGRKGLTLTLRSEGALPHCILADKGRLRQLLSNYLGNAIKYTEQGWVRLCVGWSPDAGRLRFEVEDTGCGIPEDELGHLYESFYQGSRSRGNEGLGLGLAICRRLAEAMGGEVGAANRDGGGSRFHFSMPVLDCPPGPLQAAGGRGYPRGYDGPPRRILVVDDIAQNGRVLRDWLHRLRLEVTLVDSGPAALEQLERETPDLILLDIFMPGMDGYETLRRIRRRAGDRPPVVAVTASVGETDRERVVAAGFDGFIAKPIEVERLTEVLARLLDLQWRWDAVAEDGANPASPPDDSGPLVLDAAAWATWQALGAYPSFNTLTELGERMRAAGLGQGDTALQQAGKALTEAADSFDPEHCAAVVRALTGRVQSAATDGSGSPGHCPAMDAGESDGSREQL